MRQYCKLPELNFLPLLDPPEKTHIAPAYCFAFKERRILLICENEGCRLPTMEEFKSLGTGAIREQYMGEYGDTSCFVVEMDGVVQSQESVRFEELRKLYDVLGKELATLAGRAIQLLEWDTRTAFCGCCGSGTFRRRQERAKECPECGTLFFPKISPAVIVLIEKENEALLARSHGFPSGLYGLIAGFVEPGESVEEAVVREVMEEVGVSIKDLEYFGSQPWPYPDSLMIGFTAKYAGGEIRMDTREIEDARWFKHHEIPAVPSTSSISGQLITYFIERHSHPE